MNRSIVILALLVAACAGAWWWHTRPPEKETTAVFELTRRGRDGVYTYTAKGQPDGSATFEARQGAFHSQGHLSREDWHAFVEGFQAAFDEMGHPPTPLPAAYNPGTAYLVRFTWKGGRLAQESLNDAQANPLLRYVDASAALEPLRSAAKPASDGR